MHTRKLVQPLTGIAGSSCRYSQHPVQCGNSTVLQRTCIDRLCLRWQIKTSILSIGSLILKILETFLIFNPGLVLKNMEKNLLNIFGSENGHDRYLDILYHKILLLITIVTYKSIDYYSLFVLMWWCQYNISTEKHISIFL